MQTKYYTQLGNQGSGNGVNRTPDSAMKYTHDIFHRAAEEKLDVYMLCGSLQSELRDDLYRSITGVSFAQSIQRVLEAGRNVSIFIWDDASSPHSSQCIELMNQASKNPTWGKLELRSSGTRHGERSISHFIIAKSRDDDSRWILRVEQPHRRLTTEQVNSKSFEVPAAIFFDTKEAKEHGEPLLNVFNELRRRVNRPRAQLQYVTP